MSLDSYIAELPFTPDDFQKDAFAALAGNESVLVAAPTASGKTVVAEAAIHQALEMGRRAFYTTPIKALSNQKYVDFCEMFGEANVGLLTGDNSINGRAPVVVMTTEVLRNMIYVDSFALDHLEMVVLDEIHYLSDRERGPVWEEVIIHLPPDIRIVGLSATVSNAEEFAQWLRARRGEVALVGTDRRPVPLLVEYGVYDKVQDHVVVDELFGQSGTNPNPRLVRLLRKSDRRRRRFHTPRRTRMVEHLADRDLLPCIFFVFSRKGCDEGARQVSSALKLTTAVEEAEIIEFATERTAHLDPLDLEALGFEGWLHRLSRGIASHHAGLVPAFKETTEELFTAGLVQVVFATETLALGINMPARSVVIESMSKFNGETHELLKPGAFTQLTGRAGRRGLDDQGTAVILHSSYEPLERIVPIAARGSYPLTSSFRPTYNMTVNLIANYERGRAQQLLEASFGEFHRLRASDADRAAADDLAGEMTGARAQLDALDPAARQAAGADTARLVRSFVGETNPGDVLELPGTDGPEHLVMLVRGRTKKPQMQLMTVEGRMRTLKADQLPLETARVGRISLPKPFKPREAQFRKQVTALLGDWQPDRWEPIAEELVHPDASLAADLQKQIERLTKKRARVDARLRRSGASLMSQMDAALGVMEEWGYVDGWSLTEAGATLRGIYNARDLLLAECGRRGYLRDVTPPELAAIISGFVYEPRRNDSEPQYPTSAVHAGFGFVEMTVSELNEIEKRHGVPLTPAPEPGFAELAYGWASGWDLSELFDQDAGSAGDFVRNMRQILDVLRQVRDMMASESAGGVSVEAQLAISSIDRGVVSAGGGS
jgi:ATP-dependent RNA helicase HelY